MSGPPTDDAPDLGGFIRRQRELADISMRRLAAMAGISNPYLSQIERGLRIPSDQVLKAIADSLQSSAEIFRTHARHDEDHSDVIDAVRADADLSQDQQRALIEAYRAMIDANRIRHRRRGQPLQT